MAASQAALHVIGIGHEVVQPFAPSVNLDLPTNSGTTILWDFLQAPGLGAIHLGLPCRTSSGAGGLLGCPSRHRCGLLSCHWGAKPEPQASKVGRQCNLTLRDSH